MCGIIGIVGKSEVASALYDALTVLQHRGQDAAGIATIDGNRLRLHKGPGLVRDVFTREAMLRLRGNVGIGHCRYPTAGSEGSDRSAAAVRQFAVRHRALPQRQSDQHRFAAPRDRRGRSPPHQHRFRFRSAAQRARARAADPGSPLAHARSHLQGRRRRARALRRRLRGRLAAARLRRARVPRSARHPPARARRARDRRRQGIRGRFRIGRARHPRLQAACATSRRARRC